MNEKFAKFWSLCIHVGASDRKKKKEFSCVGNNSSLSVLIGVVVLFVSLF